MVAADKHPMETSRLALLQNLEILDTDAEAVFDDLTELASTLCDAPIALVSLVDGNRQWIKSRFGLDISEVSRENAFCAHAILNKGIFIVENADEDSRFSDNPLVVGAPLIKFYAGAVLRSDHNLPIGTLCVIDHEPRQFTARQQRALEIIARQVESQIEMRRKNIKLEKLNQVKKNIMSLVAHDLKGSFTSVLGFSRIMAKKLDTMDTARDLHSMGQHLISSANDVYKLLDEMLQWTEMQMGQSEPLLKRFDLAEEVSSCANLFTEIARVKNIDIQISVPKATFVYADPSITKTVLRNFLSNAVKYSPKSSRVEIGLDQNDAGPDLHLWVRDYGAGMPEVLKQTLFKSAQVSQPGTENEQGHGIGLSLCAAIAEQQDSNLWVDDTIIHGCKMCLSIPLQDNHTFSSQRA
ncbi:MAG: histidine kinase [Gammaproteobacteria bacterium]|nr:histidine kinase [Gammaproteobacteria bacterium]HBF09470.1 histidine kinase [Gammaproteobacteria bacterium]